jgi:hypothetical protein
MMLLSQKNLESHLPKLSNQDISKIIYFTEKDNIFQILYTFGEEVTLRLLQCYILEELYEECQLILDQILEHNKLTGDNISTTLEEFESLRRKISVKTNI